MGITQGFPYVSDFESFDVADNPALPNPFVSKLWVLLLSALNLYVQRYLVIAAIPAFPNPCKVKV